MSEEKLPPTPSDYALIFEDHRIGARILEDLITRFGTQCGHSSGIDRILDTQEYMGRRQVIEFIVKRINQNSGLDPNDDEETPS